MPIDYIDTYCIIICRISVYSSNCEYFMQGKSLQLWILYPNFKQLGNECKNLEIKQLNTFFHPSTYRPNFCPDANTLIHLNFKI